jgi:hypothetical protein
MSTNERLTRSALELLRSDEDYLTDARIGAPRGNSVIGSVLALTTGSPRWATEQAVLEALAQLDREGGAR